MPQLEQEVVKLRESKMVHKKYLIKMLDTFLYLLYLQKLRSLATSIVGKDIKQRCSIALVGIILCMFVRINTNQKNNNNKFPWYERKRNLPPFRALFFF